MAAVYRTPPQIASTNHTQLADIFGSPLVLLVSWVSPLAAAVLLMIVVLVACCFVLVLLARGVRGLPEFARQVRRIGEPDAWRGTADR
jgi:hypothetical protein